MPASRSHHPPRSLIIRVVVYLTSPSIHDIILTKTVGNAALETSVYEVAAAVSVHLKNPSASRTRYVPLRHDSPPSPPPTLYCISRNLYNTLPFGGRFSARVAFLMFASSWALPLDCGLLDRVAHVALARPNGDLQAVVAETVSFLPFEFEAGFWPGMG